MKSITQNTSATLSQPQAAQEHQRDQWVDLTFITFLYLDDAHHTLSLVHDYMEGLADDFHPVACKRLTSMFGHVHLLVSMAFDKMNQVVKCFQVGEAELQSIENTLDTLAVLGEIPKDRFPGNTFFAINDGLYQALEAIKEKVNQLQRPSPAMDFHQNLSTQVH